MASKELKREVELFQNTVKSLSSSIEQSGVEWNDEKYSELASKIRGIASSSKQIIISSNRVCEAMDKFEKIAKEEI